MAQLLGLRQISFPAPEFVVEEFVFRNAYSGADVRFQPLVFDRSTDAANIPNFDFAGFDYWSPELFRIHGSDPANIAPTVQEYLDLLHPEDREVKAMAVASPAQNEYPLWCCVFHEPFLPASFCLAAGFSSYKYLISTLMQRECFYRG
jgi:hypothetical protein